MEARPAGRSGFQLDLNLCTGCQACVVACAIENELPWGTSWRWVDTFNGPRLPGIPVHHLSLACNHCEEAPCAKACPAVAYDRDPLTGAVLLDSDKCIGCRYCTWACPYDAPKYDPEAGVVSKCTFCHDRQLEGLTPACANQCPTGALRVGPLDSLEGASDVPGFPSTPAAPAIRFVPLRGGVEVPDRMPVAGAAGADLRGLPEHPPVTSVSPGKASFKSEAPLWIFTLVVSILAGVMATEAGRAALPWRGFLAGVVLAAAASTLHLGRTLRAWRAALGWRTSWLSREILFFNAFAAAGVLELSGVLPGLAASVAGEGAEGVTGPFVALLGFGTLFSIDRVYGVTRTRDVHLHSAGALSTGLLTAGVVAGFEVVWGAVLLLKLLSYGVRKHRLRLASLRWRRRVSTLRIGIALAGAALLSGGTPVSALLLGPRGGAESTVEGATYLTLALGLVCLFVSEAIDRAEFYEELEVSTPASAIRSDLVALSSARGDG